MPDDTLKDQPVGEAVVQDQSVAASQPINDSDHIELLRRARTFLTSPQVRLQDSDAKRAFLKEKGLTQGEVDQLLRELPPAIPPRAYPSPPPSTLPSLLLGVTRIFTWLTGASAIVLFVFYRYLLPRIVQSYKARITLRKHHSELTARLAESAAALKSTQVESYKGLPRAGPIYEDPQYAHHHTIDDLLLHVDGSHERSTQPGAGVPDVTILRCAFEELDHSGTDGTSAEELFRHLENKLPWLGREGAARQNELWNQLNASPLFTSFSPVSSESGATSSLPPEHPARLLWKYVPPPAPVTSPFLATLANLRTVLDNSREAPSLGTTTELTSGPTLSARQRTLQVLSNFTGYITAQAYSLAIPSTRGTSTTPGGNPAEDEFRREIRTLKGLVLNRRSFLPSSVGAPGLPSALPYSP